jgi:hypothetical protein
MSVSNLSDKNYGRSLGLVYNGDIVEKVSRNLTVGSGLSAWQAVVGNAKLFTTTASVPNVTVASGVVFASVMAAALGDLNTDLNIARVAVTAANTVTITVRAETEPTAAFAINLLTVAL